MQESQTAPTLLGAYLRVTTAGQEEDSNPVGGGITTSADTYVSPRWAIYIRGEDQDSMNAQEDLCRRVAQELLGFTTEPVRIYRDNGAGNDLDRPGLRPMLLDAQAREIDAVIVDTLDRFSRSLLTLLAIRVTLERVGVRIHVVTHPQDPAERNFSEGTLIQKIEAFQHQVEGHQISRRTKRGLERVARQGRMPNGNAPFGYSYEPKTKSRTVNEPEAERVRYMFDMAADGKTLYEIARTLNQQGATNRNGKRWTKAAVGRILRNPANKGICIWRHIRIEGAFSPIVGQDLFDQVQEKLGCEREDTNPLSLLVRCGACDDRDSLYLLGGMVLCGRCGRPMRGTRTAKGLRYYRCSGQDSGCDAHSIDAAVLEAEVWAYVEELFRDLAGTVEEISQENGNLTADGRFDEWIRPAALRLVGIDQKVRKTVLAELGIRVTSENRPDGIWIRVESTLNTRGTPPATS